MADAKPQEVKAVQRHAMTLYRMLAATAKQEQDGVSVFRGSLSNVFAQAGLSQGYYSQVYNILILNGCIDILQRGARGIDSVVVLYGIPDDPSELKLPERTEPRKDLTTDPVFASLEGRVKAIEELTGGLNIVQALLEVEDRLAKLEVEALGNGKTSQPRKRTTRRKEE